MPKTAIHDILYHFEIAPFFLFSSFVIKIIPNSVSSHSILALYQ